MKFVALTILTMFAFAANSILTRIAIEGGHIDPPSFAIVRVFSGAVVLGVLLLIRGGALPLMRWARLPGAISLTVYMIGFSLAYLTLDAGLGALILFGVVQIVMFAHAAVTGSFPLRRQFIGAGVAFAGLLLALWPGADESADLMGALLMVGAGLGWAAYTISGREAVDPLASTAANFILCMPLLFALLSGSEFQVTLTGTLLGVLCGGVTSGLGYALWYNVLRQLDSATAATIQLSVPILAIFAGVVLLDEALTPALVVSAALVVGGVAWAIRRPQTNV